MEELYFWWNDELRWNISNVTAAYTPTQNLVYYVLNTSALNCTVPGSGWTKMYYNQCKISVLSLRSNENCSASY